MKTPLGYPAPAWKLFLELPRAGRFDAKTDGVRAAEAGSPAGRQRLRLECRIDGERVIEARFQALGCPFTLAVGAWLAGWSEGRTVAEIGRLGAPEVAAALEIPDDRAHCALMAEDVVRALANEWNR